MLMKDIIHEKRRELGLTQEQIAHCLGVSTPAVNKWENGQTYPDVTLLPALARLLKTDLNTLLCFQVELSKEEIAVFLNEIVDIGSKESMEHAVMAVQEKIKEYPACEELLYQAATILQGLLILYPCPEEECQKYRDYVLELYERVEKGCNSMLANRARYMLASKSIQAKDYGKAQELIDRMPEYDSLDKDQLKISMWMEQEKHQEAAELLEKKINGKVQEIFLLLNQLATTAVREGDSDRAWILADYSQKLLDIYGWSYNIYVVPFSVAVEEKDADKCVELLDKMLSALEKPIPIMDSVLYAHMKKKDTDEKKITGKRFLDAILTEIEKNERYSFLSDNPEIQRLLKKYQKKTKI